MLFKEIKSYEVVCDRCGLVVTKTEKPVANLIIGDLGFTYWVCDGCLKQIPNILGLGDTEKVEKDPDWDDEPEMIETKTLFDDMETLDEDSKQLVKEAADRTIKTNPYYINNWQWNNEKIETLIQMYNSHNTYDEMAKELKVTTPSIRGMLSRIRESKPGTDLYFYKDKLGSYRLTEGQKEKIKELYFEHNLSIAKIADQLNISYFRVWSYCNKLTKEDK